MSEQTFNTRIILKHDIEANWNKAAGFTPRKGEIVIYDADETHAYNRIKIGDGVKPVSVNQDSYHADALPFYSTIKDDGPIVTKESIEAALGYTPADDNVVYEEIDKIYGTISELYNYVIEGGFETDDDGNVTAVHLGFSWEDILNAYSANHYLICLMLGPDEKYIQFTPSEFYLGDGHIVFTAVGKNGNSYELGLYEDGTSYMRKLPMPSAVTSDWNQNDETASDYVKNRTHWKGSGLQEVYSGALSFSDIHYDPFNTGSDTDYLSSSINLITHPTAGVFPSHVFISINGVQYKCPVAESTNNTAGSMVPYQVEIMDGNYLGVYVSYRGYNALMIVCTADLSSSEFIVSVDGNVYHPLDEGFIPVTIARTSDVQIMIDDSINSLGELVGKNVAGQSFTVGNESIIAGYGAEIFNDYTENIATGVYSHAEGTRTCAKGQSSHAEGSGSHAESQYSHAEGHRSHAKGGISHAEGVTSHTEGWSSHAEGYASHAEGYASHAEGQYSHAEGQYSHAEGQGYSQHTIITGAPGSTVYTVINNINGLVVGASIRHTINNNDILTYNTAKITSIDTNNKTITVNRTLSADTALSNAGVSVYISGMALGNNSHSEGNQTIAAGRSQHTQGEFNTIDPEYDVNDNNKRGKYAHIVGNGTSHTNRSNAHTLDWDGNAWFAGGLKVGGTGQDDENAVAVLTTADMDDIIAKVLAALPTWEGGSY